MNDIIIGYYGAAFFGGGTDMPRKLEEVIKYMESIADYAEMEKHINK